MTWSCAAAVGLGEREGAATWSHAAAGLGERVGAAVLLLLVSARGRGRRA